MIGRLKMAICGECSRLNFCCRENGTTCDIECHYGAKYGRGGGEGGGGLMTLEKPLE